MAQHKKGTVIFGILNWGLGHAARSAKLIEELTESGFEVVIASDGAALDYLQQRFSGFEFEKLPGYNIRYRKGNQLWGLALQLPSVNRARKAEHRILKKLCEKYGPVGIISDNRLGFRNKNYPSVYITHQLKLMLPFGRKAISQMHRQFIDKFDECWVPDVEGSQNLAGEMAHDLKPGVPVKYIGFLSRFSGNEGNAREKKYNACVILSGPENQRTVLEEILLGQLQLLPGNYFLIRGTQTGPDLPDFDNIQVQDFADQETIRSVVAQSEIVISRSGYTSLMDYFFLRNKALLIPTPGQPEQEYLARYQLSKGRFGYVAQSEINLQEDLPKARAYPGFTCKEMPQRRGGLFGLFKGKGKG